MHHLIDIETGRVIEFEDAAHEQLIQAIAARLGFELVSYRLELFGRKPAQPAAGEARPRARDARSKEPGARDPGTRESGTRDPGGRDKGLAPPPQPRPGSAP